MCVRVSTSRQPRQPVALAVCRRGSEANPIQFRIGINVGDIIIEGEDILGDGVNIAARIEGIAEPGGISISEDAWRQVQGKVATNFVDAGEQCLKNIARPVRVYQLDLAPKAATASDVPRPMPAQSDKHVRRILRFAYLAPDIVEAIAEGRQPRILTVKLLLKGVPLDWADQRAAFGFR
jgi:Adenylate and Guanylate cyclase catalytic domain